MSIVRNVLAKKIQVTVELDADWVKVVNAAVGAKVKVEPSKFAPAGLTKALEYGIGRFLMDGAKVGDDDDALEIHQGHAETRLAQLKGEEPIRRVPGLTVEKFFVETFKRLVPAGKRKKAPKLIGSLETMKEALVAWRPGIKIEVLETQARSELKAAIARRKKTVVVDILG